MKKYILYFMTALFLLGATGCSKNSEPSSPKPQAQGAVPQEMATMVEPIDALMRCMLENNTDYDATDPEFFWSALYYFLGNSGAENSLVTVTDDGRLKVPKKVAQEYAIALFATYDDLLPLPESLSNSITYDKDWDAYLLSQGDRGLSETNLSDYRETENGYVITAKLVSTMEDKEVLGKCQVTMQKNAFADGIVDPRYFYSIATMTKEEGFAPPTQTASAVFNGLVDGHTVEITLEDGTIQAFQFYDETVSEKLHNMKEKDAFSFVYSTDEEAGASTILEIK